MTLATNNIIICGQCHKSPLIKYILVQKIDVRQQIFQWFAGFIQSDWLLNIWCQGTKKKGNIPQKKEKIPSVSKLWGYYFTLRKIYFLVLRNFYTVFCEWVIEFFYFHITIMYHNIPWRSCGAAQVRRHRA